VIKTEQTGEITGKINANPNPLFFGQRCVISWETNGRQQLLDATKDHRWIEAIANGE
jgi:hypothetical protein